MVSNTQMFCAALPNCLNIKKKNHKNQRNPKPLKTFFFGHNMENKAKKVHATGNSSLAFINKHYALNGIES